MKRLLSAASIALSINIYITLPSFTQEPAPQQDIAAMDPGQCGAAGRGCASDLEKAWMAHGNDIADLSSADLAVYAATCAARPDLQDACYHDPYLILDYVGVAYH
ncbi:hypothetical protein [Aminobacter sp. MET-1]|uniref:hypothetical protein n=1 Tax=Aminobacter sp. MET-1 TaxID=2951085 RepID=UPI00226AE543|nr:hypothetical protein [Aminobacter sp. MET-1]MCX8571167.1 hypothetical protein [Aminobacter sp. MET-1]MCX8573335.1 hypothetical protein [Aminobacter sp. MET-1]